MFFFVSFCRSVPLECLRSFSSSDALYCALLFMLISKQSYTVICKYGKFLIFLEPFSTLSFKNLLKQRKILMDTAVIAFSHLLTFNYVKVPIIWLQTQLIAFLHLPTKDHTAINLSLMKKIQRLLHFHTCLRSIESIKHAKKKNQTSLTWWKSLKRR